MASSGVGETHSAVLAYDFASEEAEGPRSPRYPHFSTGNTAGTFGKEGQAIVIKSRGDLQFGLGDSITMEAWVTVESMAAGHMPYLIGKGRHGNQTDQSYAMRLKADEGGTRLGFLFASEAPETDSAGASRREWHRWWSKGVLPRGAWHHVAVVYTFGKGDSLRAYINGQETEGTWDLGGKTDFPPVSNESDVVIGTGYRRGPAQTFHGRMDEIRIHGRALSSSELTSRYRHVPPPPPVRREMLTPGKVLVQISEEGVPEARAWPEEPLVTETYPARAFGFAELPQKYISTGVRADRANPSHFRASALVTLPPGKHRLLLRGRGAARLYVEDALVLETPFPSGDTGGHGKLASQDRYLDLGPDFRFAPPGNREAWTALETRGGEQLIILETLVGGVVGKGRNKRRPELGETVVAISPEGASSWWVLSPDPEASIPYTDEGWRGYAGNHSQWVGEENRRRRAAQRAAHRDYWDDRRSLAASWLAQTQSVPVPELPRGYAAHNPIDHFLARKIDEVRQQSQTTGTGEVHYFRDIQPLLEAKCYSCHQGSKLKGGLRLDTREGALRGGDADGPALEAGDLEGSALLWRVHPDAGDDLMPPKGDPLTEGEIALLEQWIIEGASWPAYDVPSFELTPLASDLVFLRRLALDTVGVPPTEKEIDEFLAEPEASRRSAAIDRFVGDDRWADHWTGYWQDVLAENPNIINPTLNNTGPFRWWIYESLLDNKPMDLFVTELLRMEGSDRFGGPRGFGTASENDVPMAAKGIIASAAFLGTQMKCARCHDAPGHPWKQEELFQMAAMLARKPIKVPETSSVPMDQFHQRARKPLIEVTLAPGSTVSPAWPFADLIRPEEGKALAEDPNNTRDQLAAMMTSPQNERFAQVTVNRIWQRIMGRGLVADVDDWEKEPASHPDLLRWLGRRLIAAEYDGKSIAKLIFSSHAYQRAIDPRLLKPSPLFIAPAPRRLQAEQIVDTLFSTTGAPFDVGEVSL
ncbi:MAG: DUF1553 domain-containing protein, partial [Verrucomicrobiota bacterium]